MPQGFILFLKWQKTKKQINNQISMPISTHDDLSKWNDPDIRAEILPLICETSNIYYSKTCSFVNELIISIDPKYQ